MFLLCQDLAGSSGDISDKTGGSVPTGASGNPSPAEALNARLVDKFGSVLAEHVQANLPAGIKNVAR